MFEDMVLACGSLGVRIRGDTPRVVKSQEGQCPDWKPSHAAHGFHVVPGGRLGWRQEVGRRSPNRGCTGEGLVDADVSASLLQIV